MKFHTAQSGKQAGNLVPCTAQKACRIGGGNDHNYFDSVSDAREYQELIYAQEYAFEHGNLGLSEEQLHRLDELETRNEELRALDSVEIQSYSAVMLEHEFFANAAKINSILEDFGTTVDLLEGEQRLSGPESTFNTAKNIQDSLVQAGLLTVGVDRMQEDLKQLKQELPTVVKLNDSEKTRQFQLRIAELSQQMLAQAARRGDIRREPVAVDNADLLETIQQRRKRTTTKYAYSSMQVNGQSWQDSADNIIERADELFHSRNSYVDGRTMRSYTLGRIGSNGDVITPLGWTDLDTFGYELNGNSFTLHRDSRGVWGKPKRVPRGGTYVVSSSASLDTVDYILWPCGTHRGLDLRREKPRSEKTLAPGLFCC